MFFRYPTVFRATVPFLRYGVFSTRRWPRDFKALIGIRKVLLTTSSKASPPKYSDEYLENNFPDRVVLKPLLLFNEVMRSLTRYIPLPNRHGGTDQESRRELKILFNLYKAV